ncbi:MAG: hypothetical protein WD059_07870 [Balneolaceae bacterium]
MKHTKLFIFLLMIGFAAACSQSDTENEASAIQQDDTMESPEQFEKELAALEAEDESTEILAQKEQTHLRYGIYLIYTADPSNMRENANDALRQFIEVLKINPENEKAKSEIEQILGIYRTFPDRKPADDVVEDLQELGFEL